MKKERGDGQDTMMMMMRMDEEGKKGGGEEVDGMETEEGEDLPVYVCSCMCVCRLVRNSWASIIIIEYLIYTQ